MEEGFDNGSECLCRLGYCLVMSKSFEGEEIHGGEHLVDNVVYNADKVELIFHK